MMVESLQSLPSLLQMEANPCGVVNNFIVKFFICFYYDDDVVYAEWQWILVLVVGVLVIGAVVTVWAQHTTSTTPTTPVCMLSMS